MKKARVRFLPDGKEVDVEGGTTLLQAASLAGIGIASSCGGKGLCGKCAVEVVKAHEGSGPPTRREIEKLSEAELARGGRLACSFKVEGDVVVRVPPASRADIADVLAAGAAHDAAERFPFNPAVRRKEIGGEPKRSSSCPRARRRYGVGDLEFLGELLEAEGEAPLEADLGAARGLPGFIGEGGRGRPFSAFLRGRRLVGLGPGGAPLLGAAFDIGTTTVAGLLLDLADGAGARSPLAVSVRTNPQTEAGDDVVSRIEYASRSAEALGGLKERIVSCLAEMLDELAGRAGRRPEDVYEVVAAGNTVMTHLLLGLPPAALGESPFSPVLTGPVELGARELGLPAAGGARVWCFPSVAGYVGGDIVAGLVAVGPERFEKGAVYIDAGTNGEIVAGAGGRLLAASTAAGPAFEGARISCGMRAAFGAVAHAEPKGDGRIGLDVIGGGEPLGVCGTGLVDLAAAFLRTGAVEPSGSLREGQEGVIKTDSGLALDVAPGISLTQKDIRELQLAKAAIAAGVEVLLEELGLAPGEVREVLLAGAFGSSIRPESARELGLVPRGVAAGAVRSVGNAALAGARAALISVEARRAASELARRGGRGRSVEYVELSARGDFMDRFADNMPFPARASVSSRLASAHHELRECSSEAHEGDRR